MEYALLLAISDRIRGSGWFRFNHPLGLVGMAISVGLLLHVHGWQWLAAVATIATGSVGLNPALSSAFLGTPMPASNTWWIFGPLKKSALLANIFRGLLWMAPLVFVKPLAVLCFAVPFVVSPYIFGRFKIGKLDMWGLMEFSRSLVAGALIVLAR